MSRLRAFLAGVIVGAGGFWLWLVWSEWRVLTDSESYDLSPEVFAALRGRADLEQLQQDGGQ